MRSEIDGRTGFLKQHRHLVTQLRIVDCDSYGEWNMDIFSDLLIDLPRLRHLLINSKFSSNWLKYRQDDNLQQLTLYFEPQDTRQVPGEIVSSSSTTTTTTINRIFSLEHIANFKMLTKLRLWHYHLYWEDIPCIDRGGCRAPQLHVEFPFTLSQFNYNSNIRRLVVSYAEGNAFAVSERYREFCNMETEKTFQVWRSLRSLWREESQQQRDVTVHEHWQLSETKSIAGSCKGRRIQPIALVWKVADKQYVAGTRHAGGLRSS